MGSGRPGKVLLFFSGLIGFLILAFFVLRLESTRQWIRMRISDWIAREYQVALQYDSLQVENSPFGWRLMFQNLLLEGQTIRSVEADINPWKLLLGKPGVSLVKVRGADLHFAYKDDQVFLDRLVKRFHGSKDMDMDTALPHFHLEDIHLALEHPAIQFILDIPRIDCPDPQNCKGSAELRRLRWTAEDRIPDLKVDAAQIAIEDQDVRVEFDHLSFRYARSWPELHSCRGRLLVQKGSLHAKSIHCRSAGLEAESQALEIRDVFSGSASLELRLRVSGSMDSSLRFLDKTPLSSLADRIRKNSVRAARQQTIVRVSGPLSSEEPLTISGSSRIHKVEIESAQSLISGSSPLIELSFDRDGLKNLQSDFLVGQDRLSLSVQREGEELEIRFIPRNASSTLQGSFRLRPAHAPSVATGRVSDFKLAAGAGILNLQRLVWRQNATPNLRAEGRLDIRDFGSLSHGLGLLSDFRGGRGQVVFDLAIFQRNDADRQASLAGSAHGYADIDLRKGEVKKLPRIVNAIISFANLKVFGIRGDELSYDSMKGRLNFAAGRMTTEDFRIGLGIIKVEASGWINYADNVMDMNLRIIPDLGAPAAALAIGLWNPLVGLTLYGLSRLHKNPVDSRLNRAISQVYKLEGPRTDPHIRLVKAMDIKELWQ